MGQLVSKSGFARMNGWVPSYVSQLNKEGRLVLDASGKKVDVEATMALLGKTADPARSGVGDRHARERVERNIMPAAILAAAAEEAADTDGGDLPTDGYDFQAARAKKETHLAGIAELEERKQLRQLVELSKVQLALTDNAAAMRAALERLPDRIAPVLAAESDPRRIYQLLDDEIGLVLDELAKIAERLPARLFGTR
ncbi:hypothetical protein JCM19000A_32710 [Silvimonas sp. JCM 19000]